MGGCNVGVWTFPTRCGKDYDEDDFANSKSYIP